MGYRDIGSPLWTCAFRNWLLMGHMFKKFKNVSISLTNRELLGVSSKSLLLFTLGPFSFVRKLASWL